MVEKEISIDTHIVREGEPGNSFFIIAHGEVEVIKGASPETPKGKQLAILKKNDFFGEMSLLECRERSASVIAKTPTKLWELKGTDLFHLFEKAPDQYAIIILNIARDIARRLHHLNEVYIYQTSNTP